MLAAHVDLHTREDFDVLMVAFDSHMVPFRDEAWAVRESAVLSAIRHVLPGTTAMGAAPMQPTNAQVSSASALPVGPTVACADGDRAVEPTVAPAHGDSTAARMDIDDDLVSPSFCSRTVVDRSTLFKEPGVAAEPEPTATRVPAHLKRTHPLSDDEDKDGDDDEEPWARVC